MIQGARPILLPWNNFNSTEKHRKAFLRRSPRKKATVADCSEQQDVQQDLFEIDYNIQLDDSLVDFEKTTKGLTDKASQTVDFNNTQEDELKRLKYSVKELREKICDHILQIMLYPQMNYATIIQDFHQLMF